MSGPLGERREKVTTMSAQRQRPPKAVRDYERQAKAEAVSAFLTSQGWLNMDGDETGQCRCGHIGPGGDFVSRRLLGDRGPLIVSCRTCAAATATANLIGDPCPT